MFQKMPHAEGNGVYGANVCGTNTSVCDTCMKKYCTGDTCIYDARDGKVRVDGTYVVDTILKLSESCKKSDVSPKQERLLLTAAVYETNEKKPSDKINLDLLRTAILKDLLANVKSMAPRTVNVYLNCIERLDFLTKYILHINFTENGKLETA